MSHIYDVITTARFLSVWVIYYVSEAVAGRSLSYDTNPFYNLHIQCSDAAGVKGAEKIFTVHINDNKAPTIDILSSKPNNICLIKDALREFFSVI
ncbi:hypothetical protein DPMN_137636 [Dreissena polymorpha]|uniref:Uncharacterized protein n=1 Tax=Dreissena polymorpha TaxID=45954 RepID=A0A9D4G269_DREPO|nr:hypothetical protein DPMN_137636 [Dreissena polymorpha]